MIGFHFNGIKRTVHLPAEKARAYIKEAHTVLRQKTVPSSHYKYWAANSDMPR